MDEDTLSLITPVQLESFSVKELEEYIRKLQERMTLVKNLITNKLHHQQTVNKLFK